MLVWNDEQDYNRRFWEIKTLAAERAGRFLKWRGHPDSYGSNELGSFNATSHGIRTAQINAPRKKESLTKNDICVIEFLVTYFGCEQLFHRPSTSRCLSYSLQKTKYKHLGKKMLSKFKNVQTVYLIETKMKKEVKTTVDFSTGHVWDGT